MISTREFSELLLSIRSTATNFSNWEGFLDQLSRLTEARAALVILRRPEAGINKIVALGGTHSASERTSLYVNSQKLYAECYGSQDPFHAALMRSRLKGVIPGEALIPSQILQHSDMYHSLLAPNDLEHMCLASLTRSNNLHHQLAIWREHSSGRFLPDECDWLTLLIPHLQTTLAVQRNLGLKGEQLTYSEAMLQEIEDAMFLLNCNLRVVHINNAAEHLLHNGDVFYVRAGTLQIREAHTHRQFRELSAQIVARTGPEKAHPGGTMSLSFSKPHTHTAYALVAPIVIRLTDCAPATHILLLVKNTPKRTPLMAEAMYQLWACTAAESAVATLLMADRSTQEIASIRRVGVGTVRNQIKSLLSKTGTRRQSELMRLLLGLPCT